MTAMRAALVSLGIPDSEIRQETFGGAPVSRPAAEKPAAVTASTVHFARSGITAIWDGSCDSLLDLAEAHGLTPDFSCRAGICGSCACRKTAGDVTYTEELIDSPEEGEVLLCCSVPRGNLALDL